MQSDESTRPYRVEAVARAAVFDNPLRVRVLVACGTQERSLSDLRQLLGLPFAKLHYHVTRLLAAKLLTVSRTQQRAGRPVRYYRAVAERFIVPQESLVALPGEALAAELRRSLQDEVGRAGEVSLLYGPGPAPAGYEVRLLRPEQKGTPRAMERWRILALAPRSRAALAKELSEILERYAKAEPEPGAELFLAHTAFAPKQTG